MFAEEFEPLYSLEKLEVSDLPFHFTFTPTSDDGLWFFVDNCDNQRTTDWGSESGESVDSIQVQYMQSTMNLMNFRCGGNWYIDHFRGFTTILWCPNIICNHCHFPPFPHR